MEDAFPKYPIKEKGGVPTAAQLKRAPKMYYLNCSEQDARQRWMPRRAQRGQALCNSGPRCHVGHKTRSPDPCNVNQKNVKGSLSQCAVQTSPIALFLSADLFFGKQPTHWSRSLYLLVQEATRTAEKMLELLAGHAGRRHQKEGEQEEKSWDSSLLERPGAGRCIREEAWHWQD